MSVQPGCALAATAAQLGPQCTPRTSCWVVTVRPTA